MIKTSQCDIDHEDDMFIPMISKVSGYSAETAYDLLKERCGADYFKPYAPESREAIIAHFLREQPEGNYFELAAWLRGLSEDPMSYDRFVRGGDRMTSPGIAP
jgi:hypothetical protein